MMNDQISYSRKHISDSMKSEKKGECILRLVCTHYITTPNFLVFQYLPIR